MLRIPAFLKPGDQIALISPSRFAEPEQIASAQTFANAHGWELVLAPGLGDSDHDLADSEPHRQRKPGPRRARLAPQQRAGCIRSLSRP